MQVLVAHLKQSRPCQGELSVGVNVFSHTPAVSFSESLSVRDRVVLIGEFVLSKPDSGPMAFLNSVYPPNISPIIADHEELFDLPAIRGGG